MKTTEFARRRRQLMRMMGHDSIAILPTALEKIRNRDAEYPFRPDSDFYYLTGFPEPEAVLVLVPAPRAPAHATAPTMPSPSATSTTSCPA